MKTIEHYIPNHAGWHLSLIQTWDPDKLDRKKRPVLIVPGYGMNSFIFSYHPTGASLEGHLVQRGFEVWRVDLRAQGKSVSVGGGDDYGLEDLALTDLGIALRAVIDRTRTDRDRADVIGASLGGTIMFTHAVLDKKHRIGSFVAMGSPVRWVKIHPVIKLAFASPVLVGLVRFKGTRKLAELALPEIVRRTPWLLSIYMNPDVTDLSAAREMVRTVEDPNRHVNREIAQWIRDKDLILKGINIAEGLASLERPLLCVLAKGDGVVPQETAEFCYRKVGSKSKKLLVIGNEDLNLGHADLFVSKASEAHVFEPLSTWLAEQGDG